MNRPFWSFRTSSVTPCDALEPLLPLYADGMASPSEIRQVEAHLPDCESCRAELAWMQATHAALASRPVAVPPPDLHARIALAIAASAPAPVTLRPARVFTVRTAYAAAASVTVLGIALSYSLWHTPGQVVVKHSAQHNAIAFVPTAKVHALPKTTKQPRVASSTVKPFAVKRIVVAHKTGPAAVTPPEYIASNVLPTKLPASPQRVKAPTHHAASAPLLASNHVPLTEKLITPHSEKIITPKPIETPKVANVFKEPVHVHIDIQPPIVTVSPPVVRTASDDPLSGFKAQLKERNAQMRNVSYAVTQYTKRIPYSGATNLMRSMDDSSRVANIGDIHSP